MVLADGQFVVASAKENSDLFWAVRGGGGNFGVVTSFLFKGQPVHTVYGGPMFWPLEDAGEMMRWYRDFIVKAPDDVYGFFAFHTIPPVAPFPERFHLKKMCGIVWCYTGPIKKAEKVFKSIRKFKTPALDLVGPIAHPALQSLFDRLYPPGMQWYWKADFVRTLPDEAIAQHVKYAATLPTLQATMHLYPINGAASRVKQRRDSVVASRCELDRGDCGRRSRSGEEGRDIRMGQGVLERAASVFGGRRVHQLHDGGRGRADPGDVWEEL